MNASHVLTGILSVIIPILYIKETITFYEGLAFFGVYILGMFTQFLDLTLRERIKDR